MKKWIRLVIISGLIMAFTMPAFAWTQDDGKGNTFMIGGTWLTDFGYWYRSKEQMAFAVPGSTSDQTQLMLNIPAHTKVFSRLTAGNTGAFMELGLGTGTGITNATGSGDTSTIQVRKMYGFYKFGNCEIQAGKNDGWIWPEMVAQQRLGANIFTVWMFGFGAFYDGRFTQIRFTQDVSKQFTYALSLVANNTITDTATSKDSYAQIPTLAAKFKLNFGVVSLFPAVAYSQVKWDKMPGGYDDNVTAYYMVLPVRVTAGPFTGIFQAGYGQNIGNMLKAGSTSGGNTSMWQVYQRLSNGQIKNTTALNGYVDLGYTIGPATPHLFFGYDNASNSDAWKTGDSSNTRLCYGLSVNYNISPNFMISPEFSIFDWGNKPGVSGSPSLGRDWMGGLQFVFTF